MMGWVKRWLLVALDAVPYAELLCLAEERDAMLGEICRLDDELATARESYEALRSLWIPEEEIPTVVGMQPMDDEEVVR